MVGCVLSQLKPSELHILRPRPFPQLALLGLYPIPNLIAHTAISNLPAANLRLSKVMH